MIKKLAEIYLDYLLTENSPCCQILGSDTQCDRCPHYQLRKINLRKKMSKPIPPQYEKIWQDSVKIAEETEEICLKILEKNNDLVTNQSLIYRLENIVQQSKQSIDYIKQLS